MGDFEILLLSRRKDFGYGYSTWSVAHISIKAVGSIIYVGILHEVTAGI